MDQQPTSEFRAEGVRVALTRGRPWWTAAPVSHKSRVIDKTRGIS